MPIAVECFCCGSKLKVPDRLVGKTVRCPQGFLLLPVEEPGQPASPPSPASPREWSYKVMGEEVGPVSLPDLQGRQRNWSPTASTRHR